MNHWQQLDSAPIPGSRSMMSLHQRGAEVALRSLLLRRGVEVALRGLLLRRGGVEVALPVLRLRRRRCSQWASSPLHDSAAETAGRQQQGHGRTGKHTQ